jgi:hypothetical protein
MSKTHKKTAFCYTDKEVEQIKDIRDGLVRENNMLKEKIEQFKLIQRRIVLENAMLRRVLTDKYEEGPYQQLETAKKIINAADEDEFLIAIGKK